MAKVCEHCRGRGWIPESPCETCGHGSYAVLGTRDGHGKIHAEIRDCRDNCPEHKEYCKKMGQKIFTDLKKTRDVNKRFKRVLAEPTELLDIINGKRVNKNVEGAIK